MNAYTPGPWTVVERETLEDGSVYPRHIIGGARGLEVCWLESHYSAQQGDTSDVMFEAVGDVRSKAANARLIAAAPELLEALIDLCEALNQANGVKRGDFYHERKAARAAIAKAKGKTP